MAASAAQQFTAKKKSRFLEALSRCGNVSSAALQCGVSRRTVYDYRASDPLFAADWVRAAELGVDALEDEARRRAYEGTAEPLTSAKGLILDADGAPVTVQRYSDTLLIFLLKGAKPNKYRDNIKVSAQLEHSIVPVGPAQALAAELMRALHDMPEARAVLASRLLAAPGVEA